MARPRSKKSTNSFGGYDLDDDVEEKFKAALTERGLSAKQVVRLLIRKWTEAGTPGSFRIQRD